MKNSQCVDGYVNYLKGKYFGILNDYEKNKDFDKLLESGIFTFVKEPEDSKALVSSDEFIHEMEVRELMGL